MNLKPNKHKRISFDITTMASLGFIGPPLNLAPPKKKFIFLLRSPPNYFGLKFLGPPLKLGVGLLPWGTSSNGCFCLFLGWSPLNGHMLTF